MLLEPFWCIPEWRTLMAKAHKKEVRRKFRDSVFERDGFRCVCCGFQSSSELVLEQLDAHHITPREEMPNGGYVMENGVSLCDPSKSGGPATSGCHFKAEEVLEARAAGNQYDPEPDDPYHPFAPEQLYVAVGSSWKKAVEASQRLA
jgi:hypothetical protein